MNKKIVTEQEIVDWINARLKKMFDGDFSIKHITPLSEFNENGCNWSNSVIIHGGSNQMIFPIIDEVQRLFNLK